jgi:cytochrome b
MSRTQRRPGTAAASSPGVAGPGVAGPGTSSPRAASRQDSPSPGPPSRSGQGPAKVRIWDLPTRLFHWALAACVLGSFISVNIGGMAIGWHFRFGYAILALLLFRLLWGFAGPHHARFASFPPNPAAAWRYLRGRQAHLAGHSPLGALSVYALLASLGVQAVTGLFTSDAIMWDGPLRVMVTNEVGDRLGAVHHFNRYVVIGLVLLHLAAIAWYWFARREPLVAPMITGDRAYPSAASVPAARDGTRERLLASVLLALSAGVVWLLVEGLGSVG